MKVTSNVKVQQRDASIVDLTQDMSVMERCRHHVSQSVVMVPRQAQRHVMTVTSVMVMDVLTSVLKRKDGRVKRTTMSPCAFQCVVMELFLVKKCAMMEIRITEMDVIKLVDR